MRQETVNAVIGTLRRMLEFASSVDERRALQLAMIAVDSYFSKE